MSNRQQLPCLAAFAALVALSGAVRADDYSLPDTERFGRLEASSPMTCAQAQAFAWFRHQMEISDGATEDTVAAPAECERIRFAASEPKGDRELAEGK